MNPILLSLSPRCCLVAAMTAFLSIGSCALWAQRPALQGAELAKASINGKYSGLLAQFEVPGDRATYGDYNDYGFHAATTYASRQCPAGHWVYVAPKWFIWSTKANANPAANNAMSKASVNGKYRTLLDQFNVPGDKAQYGQFKDYGFYDACVYANKQRAAGYWVYDAPTWYIWKSQTGTAANSANVSPTTVSPTTVAPVTSTPSTASMRPQGNSSGTSVSRLTAAERDEFVRYHNRVRAEVGVGGVTWSEDLARVAQEWADHLATTGTFEHRNTVGGQWTTTYGENLAQGFGNGYSAKSGLDGWYSEKRDYVPHTPISIADPNFFKIGHYTQMVWSKSQKIGAGAAEIKTGPFKGGIVVVCNYDPPGNMAGETPFP